MYSIIMIVFSLKIDVNKFFVCILTNKVICTYQAISSVLTQLSLILKRRNFV